MVPGLVVVLDVSSCLTTPQPHVATEYYMKSLRELEVERTEDPIRVAFDGNNFSFGGN